MARILRGPHVALVVASLGCNPAIEEASRGAPDEASAVPVSAARSSTAPLPSSSALPRGGGRPTDDGACRELEAVLVCLADKGLPEERPTLERKRSGVVARMADLGSRSGEACRRALSSAEAALRRAGCWGGEDAWQREGLPTHPLPEDALDETCREPSAVLVSAPRDKGLTYAFPWARQVLFAHPAFRLVAAPPAARGEVQFSLSVADRALTLVASCWDAATCNALAATYRAVVRSARPRLFCGKVPVEGDSLPAFIAPEDGRWLPEPGDWASACARIASCRIALDPETPGDPGLDCQRDPSKVALDCARRARCGDVVACLAER